MAPCVRSPLRLLSVEVDAPELLAPNARNSVVSGKRTVQKVNGASMKSRMLRSSRITASTNRFVSRFIASRSSSSNVGKRAGSGLVRPRLRSCSH